MPLPKTKTTYADWLCERGQSSDARELTEPEQEAIGRGFKANREAAFAVAREVAGYDPDIAQDIVSGGVTRLIRSVADCPTKLPADGEPFRDRLLGYVRNVAKQVAAAPADEIPVRKYWGQKLARPSNRRVPERELRQDLDWLDEAEDDSDDIDTYAIPMKPARRCGPYWLEPSRAVMRFDLDFIIECAMEMLSPMQAAVVDEFLEERSRAEISRKLGIEPKTYDTHWSRALENLRDTLLCVNWLVPDLDLNGCHFSEWNDIFAAREAQRQMRLAA